MRTMTSDAIPAATLIVWRDILAGPEILVVERSARMAFAAGAIVFPGGRVDDADRQLAGAMGRPGDASRVTAIRETIEETGVAPALVGPAEPSLGLVLQSALHRGEDFARLLGTHGLALDLDALTPFARWMPAFSQPRKFDTMFFIAPAPPGKWHPRPQESECVAAEWTSPSAMVRRIERGDANAIFPTKRNLERLAQHGSLQEALDDARGHSLDTIIPWIEEIDGRAHVRIPEGRGYPVISEPLSSALRA